MSVELKQRAVAGSGSRWRSLGDAAALRSEDALAWGGFALAGVMATAGILWLNRGTTFFADELAWFAASPGMSVGDALEPHNGHLILTSRLVYHALLETFGAGYLPFRLLGVVAVLAGAATFFVFAKSRIGPLAALAPTVLLLVLGGAWKHILIPNGFTVIGSAVLGLVALMSLERGDRRSDVAACLFLVLAIATYTVGLAFAVGCAMYLLVRRERSRLWIVVVPVLLYVIWWLWAASSDSGAADQATWFNLFLTPLWAFESLALALGSLTGLTYDFDRSAQSVDLTAGIVLALFLLAALAWRIRSKGGPAMLWAVLAVPVVYWALLALTHEAFERQVTEPRYVYPAVLAVLLIAVVAVAGRRLSRRGLAVLAGLTAVCLATNLVLLRDGGRDFRAYARDISPQLAAIEVAQPQLRPGFDPAAAGVSQTLNSPWRSLSESDLDPALAYVGAAQRYGSAGFSPTEVQDADESVGVAFDAVLVRALNIGLLPGPFETAPGSCRRYTAPPGQPLRFEVPPGAELTLQGSSADVGSVELRRLAGESWTAIGSLAGPEQLGLIIPADRLERNWHLAVGAQALRVCAIS